MQTFKLARKQLLTQFAALGWSISNPDLKVPHATRPDGIFRVWLKPQAIHYTVAHARSCPHTRGDARCIAYELDMRNTSAAMIVIMAQRITG